jgi:DNA-binding MarR family transcriptional regulator
VPTGTPTAAPVTSDQLTQLAAGLDRLMMWARRQAPAQLSSSSIATLDTLLYQGPMRISDLAVRERISQPGMTTLINKLEATGLAERIADPTDGRATLARITGEGERVLRQRHASRAAALLQHVEELAPHHQQSLVAALPAMAELTGGMAESSGSSPAPNQKAPNQKEDLHA